MTRVLRRGLWAARLCCLFAPFGCAPEPLATAGELALSADSAKAALIRNSRIPIDEQVVRVFAELWVDHALLAQAASEDGALAGLPLGRMTGPMEEDEMLRRLNSDVVAIDSAVARSELVERFAREMPGAVATASQILLLFPRSATRADRDSVGLSAARLRAEIEAGANFESYARRYSQDQGSARRGGALGSFPRGRMLQAVDSAVFSMRPGELSAPVQSALGVHLIRLDSISAPGLDEVEEELMAAILEERAREGEAAYLEELDSLFALEVSEDAAQIAPAVAARPRALLSSRARRRALVSYRDGELSVGEFQDRLRETPRELAERLAEADADFVQDALSAFARREVLIAEAERLGHRPDDAWRDSAAQATRDAIREAAVAMGLADSVRVAAGGAEDSATEGSPEDVTREEHGARVLRVLGELLAGRRPGVQLGAVSFLLRSESPWEIRAGQVSRIAEEIASPEPPPGP